MVGRRLRAQCRKPGLPAISPCRAPEAAPRMEHGSRLSNRPDSKFRTLGNTSPLTAERCHHPIPEFRTSRSRQRPRACMQRGPRVSASAADLRVPTALPAVCPSLPGVQQVLPAPGPLLTRDTRACSLPQRAPRNTARAATSCDISEVCFAGPWGPKIDFCGKDPEEMRGDLLPLLPTPWAWSEGRGQ